MSTPADTTPAQPTSPGAAPAQPTPPGAAPAQPTSPDTSLTDAPPAKPHSRQLSNFEKGKIIFAYEQGWGYQRIADHIGRPKSTVQSFIKRYTERGTHVNEKSTGRPKKISEDTKKAVLDLIEGDRSIAKMTLMQIPELNNIHPRTLDRMLRGKGVRKATKASTTTC